MKVAVIGATGRAGSEIVAELARRGHAVTAIARGVTAEGVPDGVAPVALDAGDGAALTQALRGADVVVSALRFADTDAAALIAAVRASGVGRWLIVGGAASLNAGGQRLFDSPAFPDAYRAEAAGGIAFLEALRGIEDIDWVFLSPPAEFDVGPRTGHYRTGGDDLLVAADGSSRISFADYAIAVADELETPQHHRARFTVGY